MKVLLLCYLHVRYNVVDISSLHLEPPSVCIMEKPLCRKAPYHQKLTESGVVFEHSSTYRVPGVIRLHEHDLPSGLDIGGFCSPKKPVNSSSSYSGSSLLHTNLCESRHR